MADVAEPGQRPVGNVSTNRMPLAKPSSSLHASRFGAGGAGGIVVNAARPAMSSENDAILMDAPNLPLRCLPVIIRESTSK